MLGCSRVLLIVVETIFSLVESLRRPIGWRSDFWSAGWNIDFSFEQHRFHNIASTASREIAEGLDSIAWVNTTYKPENSKLSWIRSDFVGMGQWGPNVLSIFDHRSEIWKSEPFHLFLIGQAGKLVHLGQNTNTFGAWISHEQLKLQDKSCS